MRTITIKTITHLALGALTGTALAGLTYCTGFDSKLMMAVLLGAAWYGTYRAEAEGVI